MTSQEAGTYLIGAFLVLSIIAWLITLVDQIKNRGKDDSEGQNRYKHWFGG